MNRTPGQELPHEIDGVVLLGLFRNHGEIKICCYYGDSVAGYGQQVGRGRQRVREGEIPGGDPEAGRKSPKLRHRDGGLWKSGGAQKSLGCARTVWKPRETASFIQEESGRYRTGLWGPVRMIRERRDSEAQ